jgi:hypothetical protein
MASLKDLIDLGFSKEEALAHWDLEREEKRLERELEEKRRQQELDLEEKRQQRVMQLSQDKSWSPAERSQLIAALGNGGE